MLFYKNYIIYYTVIIVVCLVKSMCIPSFDYCVSYLHGHICPYHNVWPEAVFYMIYIAYYNVYRYYCGVFSEKYVYIKFSS